METLELTLETVKRELLIRGEHTNRLIEAIDGFIKADGLNVTLLAAIAPKAEYDNPCLPQTPSPLALVPNQSIIESAVTILQTLGPQRTPDLLALMQKHGRPVNGKRPIQTLTGVLSKDKKSVHPRVRRTATGFWTAINKNS